MVHSITNHEYFYIKIEISCNNNQILYYHEFIMVCNDKLTYNHLSIKYHKPINMDHQQYTYC